MEILSQFFWAEAPNDVNIYFRFLTSFGSMLEKKVFSALGLMDRYSILPESWNFLLLKFLVCTPKKENLISLVFGVQIKPLVR